MGCEEETVVYVLDTPIGDIKLVMCDKGLHSTSLLVQTDDEFMPDLTKVVIVKNQDSETRCKGRLEQAVSWFALYFSCPNVLESFGLPALCLDSLQGKFFKDVWMTLACNVNPGQTITYGELASRVHQKGSAQAVGQAMAMNPLQIIVPCHRVIPKTGKIGQYCRGKKNKIKEWLLEFEGVKVENMRGATTKKRSKK